MQYTENGQCLGPWVLLDKLLKLTHRPSEERQTMAIGHGQDGGICYISAPSPRGLFLMLSCLIIQMTLPKGPHPGHLKAETAVAGWIHLGFLPL